MLTKESSSEQVALEQAELGDPRKLLKSKKSKRKLAEDSAALRKALRSHNENDEGHDEHGVKRRLDLPFYRVPKALNEWGKKQKPRHADWSDLFFDLIYVAVAFQAGSVLIVKNSDGRYQVDSVGYFLAIYLAVYNGWEARLLTHAFLTVDDLFHKILGLIQALAIAIAAHHIHPQSDLSRSNAKTFSVCILIHIVLHMFIWCEVWFFNPAKNARLAGRRMALLVFPGTVFMVLSVLFSWLEYSLTLIEIMWAMSFASTRILLNILILSGAIRMENSIPMHIEYTIHRYGEFVFLALGEGVLQIIVSEMQFNVTYFVQLIFSYFLLALLQLLHYSVLPFNPDDHVLRVSKRRGIIWRDAFVFYTAAIIAVGVSLKLGFRSPQEDFVQFLSYSLFATTFLLLLQQLMHVGVTHELGIRSFLHKDKRAIDADWHITLPSGKRFRPTLVFGVLVSEGHERKRVWLLKLFLTLLFLVIPALDLGERPEIVVLLCTLLLIALFIVQVATGAFKRERKFKRTLAVLRAVNKFKALRKKADAEKLKRRSQRVFVQGGVLTESGVWMDNPTEEDAQELTIDDNGVGVAIHVDDSCANDHARLSGLATASLRKLNDAKREEIHRNRGDSNVSTSSTGTSSDDDENDNDLHHVTDRKDESGDVRGKLQTVGKNNSTVNKKKKTRKRRIQLAQAVASNLELKSTRKGARKLYKWFWGLNLYQPPQTALDWEDLEEEHEVDFAGLFFDLNFVAVLFQLGKILTHSIADKTIRHVEVWYFFSIFISVYDLWEGRIIYTAMFASQDVLHKVWDIVNGLMVAILAASIPVDLGRIDGPGPRRLAKSGASSVDLVSEQRFALVFATCKLLYEIGYLMRYVEVYFQTEKQNVKLWALFMSKKGTIAILPIILSYIPISQLGSESERSTTFQIVTGLWFASYAVDKIYSLERTIRRKITEKNSTPLHLEFALRRYGEWIMLTLGEGVLQIVIADDEMGKLHFVLFGLSYLVLVQIRLTHFSIERYDSEKHAFRYSRRRGVMWTLLVPLVSMCIVAIGVGLKSILRIEKKLESNINYFWLTCGAASVCLALMWLVDFVHAGHSELTNLFASPQRLFVRGFAYLMKIIICVQLAVLPLFDTPAWNVLVVIIISFMASLPIQYVHEEHRGILNDEAPIQHPPNVHRV